MDHQVNIFLSLKFTSDSGVYARSSGMLNGPNFAIAALL